MTVEYEDAKEVERVAQSVLARWHGDLHRPNVLYLFQDVLPPSKGKGVMAKVRKATAVERHLGSFHLVMLVNKAVWNNLTESQRTALIDHEFCHVRFNADKGTYGLVGHDLEEFRDIVRRHGAWFVDIEAFNDAQAELPLGKLHAEYRGADANGNGSKA